MLCCLVVFWYATFCKEIDHLANHFDEALVWSFQQMQRQDLEIEHWWQVYGQIAILVVSSECFKVVLGCKGSWGSVPAELSSICNSSRIGMKCVGHAQSFVVGAIMADFNGKNLVQMTALPEVKPEALHLMTRSCVSEAQNQNSSATLAIKHTIAVDYCGILLDLEVVSFQGDPIDTLTTCSSVCGC